MLYVALLYMLYVALLYMAVLRQVEQALLVSRELIRVAVLWPEMWHEALEEASRQWFGTRNFEAM